MLIKKSGFPQEEELVLCTVTGINPHSVFCKLDEYDNRSGMIHISEVAPGRIRNIKEHVQMGKKVVCKVLQISKEKGHIDLSLRRVNENQKRTKLGEIKQEQFAEKIIEQTAKQLKKDTLSMYKTITEKLKDHPNIFTAFELVSHDQLNLETLLDKPLANALTEVIKMRIKPPQVTLDGRLQLTSYAPNGIHLIKDTLATIVKMGAQVHYLGAGTYHVEVVAEDYKSAEKKLKAAIEPALEYAEKHHVASIWTRKEE